MSADKLIIDVDSLKTVSDGISDYVRDAQMQLEEAMRGLRTAQGAWSDEDMAELQDSLSAFYAEVEEIGARGIALAERCDRKVAAVDRLHSLTI